MSVQETVLSSPPPEWRDRLRRSELAEAFALPQQPLWRRAARGAAWMFGLRTLEKALALVRTLVLVRFLAPHDFGVFAVVLISVSALELLNLNGLRAALLQKPDESRRDLDTVWSVLLLQNCLNAGLLLLAADAVAGFFGVPGAAALIRAFSIVLLLEALVSVGTIHFEKRLLFHKQFAYLVSSAVVELMVAVGVAAAFRTVWALVAGAVMGRGARLLASYMLQEFRPRFRIKWQNLSQLFRFGPGVWLSTALGFLLLQGDSIFVGRKFGMAALGIYTVALSLAAVTRTEVGVVLQRLIFPSLTSVQGEESELRRGYLKLLRGTAVCVIPVMVGVAALAPELVMVLLGPRWVATIPVLAMLALLGALQALQGNAGTLLRALGKSGHALAGEGIFLLLAGALIFPLAARLQLAGVALAMVVGAVAGWTWTEYCVLRQLKISFRELLHSFESSIAAAVVMVAALYLLRGLFPQPGWVSLLALIGGSALMYGLTILVAALSRKRVLKTAAAASW